MKTTDEIFSEYFKKSWEMRILRECALRLRTAYPLVKSYDVVAHKMLSHYLYYVFRYLYFEMIYCSKNKGEYGKWVM